jgi:hypothetical protein
MYVDNFWDVKRVLTDVIGRTTRRRRIISWKVVRRCIWCLRCVVDARFFPYLYGTVRANRRKLPEIKAV